MESKVRKVKDQLQPLGDLFYDVAGVALDNFTPLSAVILTVATALATYKGIVLLTEGVTKGLALAQKLLNGEMMLNPIGLIVAAIAALVAGFLYLWNTSDGFRSFWINLWNSITSTCGPVIDTIVSFFTESIPGAIDTLVETFSNIGQMIVEFFLGLENQLHHFY